MGIRLGQSKMKASTILVLLALVAMTSAAKSKCVQTAMTCAIRNGKDKADCTKVGLKCLVGGGDKCWTKKERLEEEDVDLLDREGLTEKGARKCLTNAVSCKSSGGKANDIKNLRACLKAGVQCLKKICPSYDEDTAINV